MTKLTALFPALLLTGCSFLSMMPDKLKAPELKYSKVEIKRVMQRQADADFHLMTKNPNAVGLQNVKVSYQLFYKDKPFLQGKDVLIDLAPSAESPLIVPTEIVYARVFSTSASLAQRVLAGEKSVPVRIDVVISGNPTLYDSTRTGSLFPFTVKLSRTENIPIPQDQINKIKERGKNGAIDRFDKAF